MTDKIQFCSYNVNGLVDDKKRRKIFQYLKLKKVQIAMLQETHSTDEKMHLWQSEWGGKMVCSNNTSSSKGVLLLFDRQLDFVMNRVETDSDGRYIIMEISLNESTFVLANIYAPNEDTPNFFTDVAEIIDSFENRNIIWAGDFNLVLNTVLDRYQSSHNNNRSLQILNTYIDSFELCDIWREHNPDLRTYTWCRSRQQLSRIDYFLISSSLAPRVLNTKILSSPFSDHSPVFVQFNFTDQPRGPGLWKFNVSHLANIVFVKELNDFVDECLLKSYNMDHIDKWEYLKNEIRNFCIIKSKQYAKRKNSKLKQYYHDVEQIKEKIELDPDNDSNNLRSHLQEIN